MTALQKTRPDQFEQLFASAARPAPQVVEPTRAGVRNPRQVFICHAYEDAEFAHQLATELRARGWPVLTKHRRR
jgi:hypothetical protein